VQRAFNVGLNLQAMPGQADEVGYATAVLHEISLRYCIDQTRVFCTGLSNGGRLCMRFASAMPGVFSAMAVVSSIRYPEPNLATSPMRLIAFHGTADTTNPYWGGGKADYWGPDSVVQAAAKWADFNGCTKTSGNQLSLGISYTNHTGCRENANVVLVSVRDGGHEWPYLSEHASTFKCGDADMTLEQWWDVTSLDTTWAVWKFLFHGELSISRMAQAPPADHGLIGESPSFDGRAATATVVADAHSGRHVDNYTHLQKELLPVDAAAADLASATNIMRVSVFGLAIFMAAFVLALLSWFCLSRKGDAEANVVD